VEGTIDVEHGSIRGCTLTYATTSEFSNRIASFRQPGSETMRTSDRIGTSVLAAGFLFLSIAQSARADETRSVFLRVSEKLKQTKDETDVGEVVVRFPESPFVQLEANGISLDIPQACDPPSAEALRALLDTVQTINK
jgi:hypothetical protein